MIHPDFLYTRPDHPFAHILYSGQTVRVRNRSRGGVLCFRTLIGPWTAIEQGLPPCWVYRFEATAQWLSNAPICVTTRYDTSQYGHNGVVRSGNYRGRDKCKIPISSTSDPIDLVEVARRSSYFSDNCHHPRFSHGPLNRDRERQSPIICCTETNTHVCGTVLIPPVTSFQPYMS